MLSPLFATALETDALELELSTFLAHGDYDPWGRSTGVSAVLRNNSEKSVQAYLGCDGNHKVP